MAEDIRSIDVEGRGEQAMTGRRRSRVRRWRPLTVAAVLGLSVSLSGCFGSSFAYFSHRGSNGLEMYFKVPSKWNTFSAKQLIEAANGPLSQSQINQITAGQWEMTFSAAPHPSDKQFIAEGSDYPNGVVFAKQLSENDRDALSFAALRTLILSQDPLAASSTSATSTLYNVLNYSEFTRPGGIRGSKLVTDINASKGLVETFAQVVAVDPATNYVYGLGLACRASCWGTNSGLINQVLNSWNLKEKS
jgi:hypothetical protein